MSQAPDPPNEPTGEQGISLDALAQAFAQAMGAAPKPEPGAETEPLVQQRAEAERPGRAEADWAEPAQVPDPTGEPADANDPCPLSPRAILEAMLFVGNREGQPLLARRAAELMRGVQPEEVPALIEELDSRYAAHGCPYHIAREGKGYRLTLRAAFHPVRNQFYGRIREARLSQAAVDVLALIAYQQPLTSEQVSRLRGKPSGHILVQLVHRGLLQVERDASRPRTALYRTTDRFLSLFGLESLEDLPRSEELER